MSVTGVERLKLLLFPAVAQVLEVVAATEVEIQVAIALAAPAPRPGLPDHLPEDLLDSLTASFGATFAARAVFPNGHAAGLIALDAACRKIAQGAVDACVVAGVDSYIDPQTLEWLEESDQLHGAGALNNAWGFIPGEGAAALLVVSNKVVDKFPELPRAQILGLGIDKEMNRIKSSSVCVGTGLSQAFRAAIQHLPGGHILSDVYCDMNGEPYRADEYGFSCLRIKECLRMASDFVAPADCWGDVGAASAVLHISLAMIAGSKGYAKGDSALVWASSEEGERGAVVLRVGRGESSAR